MKYFLTLSLLLSFLVINAQGLSVQDRNDIRSSLREYMELTKAHNYSNMMEYLYPPLFELASKEQMLELFKSMETLGIRLHIDDYAINGLQYIESQESEEYAAIDYFVDIRVELTTEAMQEDSIVESFMSSFKTSYNTSIIDYDSSYKTISLSGHKYVIVIKDTDYDIGKWYFLEYDEGNPQALEMLLSEEVITNFREAMKN